MFKNLFALFLHSLKKAEIRLAAYSRLNDSVAQLVEHPDFIGRVLGGLVEKFNDSVAQLVEHPDFIGRVLGGLVEKLMIP